MSANLNSKKEFDRWLDNERELGLVDFHVSGISKYSTSDEIYKSLINAVKGPKKPFKDNIVKRYSLFKISKATFNF